MSSSPMISPSWEDFAAASRHFEAGRGGRLLEILERFLYILLLLLLDPIAGGRALFGASIGACSGSLFRGVNGCLFLCHWNPFQPSVCNGPWAAHSPRASSTRSDGRRWQLLFQKAELAEYHVL